MSIVSVHGPNTMFTTEGGGTTIPSSGGGVAQATKDPTNGLKFAFSVPNPGARPAADFDWTFTGPGAPAAQPDKFSGTVTFTGPGAVTIVCTVAAGAGPPAGGTYTVTAAATAGTPRMVQQSVGGDEHLTTPTEPTNGGYDPGEFTVPEVVAHAETLDVDGIKALIAQEEAGKNRTTLVTQLGELLPFDPADFTVQEVLDYAAGCSQEELETIISLEQEGKIRTTLLEGLEALRES